MRYKPCTRPGCCFAASRSIPQKHAIEIRFRRHRLARQTAGDAERAGSGGDPCAWPPNPGRRPSARISAKRLLHSASNIHTHPRLSKTIGGDERRGYSTALEKTGGIERKLQDFGNQRRQLIRHKIRVGICNSKALRLGRISPTPGGITPKPIAAEP